MALLLLLGQCTALAQALPQRFDVPGTACSLELSDAWCITQTSEDPAQALLIAEKDGVELRLFLTKQDGWHLTDWEAALRKASGINSVLPDSIETVESAQRTYVRYRRAWGERQSQLI